MKTTIFSFVLLLGFLLPLTAQKHDYVWLFGYQSNLTDTTIGGTNINYNTSPPDIHYTWRSNWLGKASASISDAAGNLLFYTNGCGIYAPDNSYLINGDSINPGVIFNDYCQIGPLIIDSTMFYPSGNSFILPTTDEAIYYLIHNDVVPYFTDTSLDVINENAYYSKIDVSTNTVLEKNISLIHDSLVIDATAAVKHANNQDWWFFTHKRESNLFNKFLIGTNSISGPFPQAIGSIIPRTGNGGGQSLFSPDGTKYVYHDYSADVLIFDFDRSTGVLSNPIHIPIVDSAFVLTVGAAISPNSRFLYITNLLDAYQFDLWAQDIDASKVHIAHYDGFIPAAPDFPAATNLHHMQLGPDCKIYISNYNSTRYLHVIHYPDRKGLACQLEQHAIQLPTYNLRHMPYFPNYRQDNGEVCDSTISTYPVAIPFIPSPEELVVRPNPATVFATVLFPEVISKGEILLYDLHGRVVLSEKVSFQIEQILNLEFLPSGIYEGKLISDQYRNDYYFRLVVLK